MRFRDRTRIWAALVCSSLGWGTSGISIRAAFDQGLDPLTIAALRAVVSLAAVAVFLGARHRRPPSRSVWRIGTVMGVINMAAPYVFITLAVRNASAGFVGLLIANIPIGAALWAHALLPDERLHRAKVIGLVVSFSGIAVLMLSGDSGLGDEGRPLVAIALALAGVAIASSAPSYGRLHARSHRVLDLAGAQFGVGATILIVLMLAVEGLPTTGVTAAGWLLILYMGLAGTFLPFVLFYWMLQRVSATEASLPGYAVPVVGLIGGALLLGEHLTPAILGGGALVLGGVVLTERAERRRHRVISTDTFR